MRGHPLSSTFLEAHSDEREIDTHNRNVYGIWDVSEVKRKEHVAVENSQCIKFSLGKKITYRKLD